MNFKRHSLEQHGKERKFNCSLCSYKTKRGHDLKRHSSKKHPGLQIVSSLIDDLVNDAAVTEAIGPVNDSRGLEPFPPLTPFEQEHYARLAAWRAEFDLICPNFTSELRELAVFARVAE